jgi:hypothetical protein
MEVYGLRAVEQVPLELPPDADKGRSRFAKRGRRGDRFHHQDVRLYEEERSV